MNDEDDNSDNPYISLKNQLACINEISLWKAVNSMKKTKKQKRIIRAILTKAKFESGRTTYDVVAHSESGSTRSIFYRALDGELADESMLCMFMACLAAADLFDIYCKACGICLDDEYERIVHTYINENDKNYDVIDLNELLLAAGQPPLFEVKAA